MFDGTTALKTKKDKSMICSDAANDIKSKTNHFYIRLFSKKEAPAPTFRIFYTVFKQKKIGIEDGT